MASPAAHPAPARRSPPRVVVVGGGFGGMETVKALRRLPVDVALIDRTNGHLLQPLVTRHRGARLIT